VEIVRSRTPGANEEVEQDGVKRAVAFDDVRHVSHHHLDPRIVDRGVGERRQRAPAPVDHHGVELRDLDVGPGRKRIQRRAEREAHAEPTDQDAR
jgi:hypothetical protein